MCLADSGTSVSQGSSPSMPAVKSVAVPNNLLQACGLQPVVFKGGIFSIAYINTQGNIVNVPLMQICGFIYTGENTIQVI